MATYITVGDYKINNRRNFGVGTFGTVYKGWHERRGTEVAAKKIILDGSDGSKDYVMTEVRALSKVKHHPYILQFLGHNFVDYVDEEEEVHELWLFTEFCSDGSLTKYHKSHNVSFNEKVRLSHQCASAIAFLHHMEPSMLHRDLKPGNILIKNMHGIATVKIADFGLAHCGSKTVFSTVGGSLSYMAPELFGARPQYKKSIDAFSLGVLYGNFVRAPPMQDLDDDECRWQIVSLIV